MSNSVSSVVSDDIFANSSGSDTPNKVCDIDLQDEPFSLNRYTLKRASYLEDRQEIHSDGLNGTHNSSASYPVPINKVSGSQSLLHGTMPRKSSMSVKDDNLNASIILPDSHEIITLVEDSDASIFEMSLDYSDNNVITNEMSTNANILNSAKKHIIKNWLSNVALDSTTKERVEVSTIEKYFSNREDSSAFRKESHSRAVIKTTEVQEQNMKNNKEIKASKMPSIGEHNILLNNDYSPTILESKKLSLNSNKMNIKKEEQQSPTKAAGRYNLRRPLRQGKENSHENTSNICSKGTSNSTKLKPKISYRQKKKVKKHCGDEEDFMSSIINSVMSTKLSSDDESFSSARRKGVIRVSTAEDSPHKHPFNNNSDIFTPRRKLFFRKPIDNSFDDEISTAEPCEKLPLTTSTPMPKSGRLKGLGGLLSETLSFLQNGDALKNKTSSNVQSEGIDGHCQNSLENKTRNVNNRVEDNGSDSGASQMDISPISAKGNIRCLQQRESGLTIESNENSQHSSKVKSSEKVGILHGKRNSLAENIKVEEKVCDVSSSFEKCLNIENGCIDIESDSNLEDGLAACHELEAIKPYENNIYKETTQNNMSYSLQSVTTKNDSNQSSDSTEHDILFRKRGYKINRINSDFSDDETEISNHQNLSKNMSSNEGMSSSYSKSWQNENIPVYCGNDKECAKGVSSSNSSFLASQENSKDIESYNAINNVSTNPAEEKIKMQNNQEKSYDNFGETLASIDSILNYNNDESNKQVSDCSAILRPTSHDNIEGTKESTLANCKSYDSQKQGSGFQEEYLHQSQVLQMDENRDISEKRLSMKKSASSNVYTRSNINTSILSSKELINSGSNSQQIEALQTSEHDLSSNEFVPKHASLLSNSGKNNSTLPFGCKTSLNSNDQGQNNDGNITTNGYKDQCITVISDNDDIFPNVNRSKNTLKINCLNDSFELADAMDMSVANESDLKIEIEEPQKDNSIYEFDAVLSSHEKNNFVETDSNKTKTSNSMEQNVTTVILSDSDDSFSNICRSKTPMKKKNYLNYSMEGDIIKIKDVRDFNDSFTNKPSKTSRKNNSQDKYDPDVLIVKSNDSSFTSDSESPNICHEIINSNDADSLDTSSEKDEEETTPWADLATYLKRNIPAGSIEFDEKSKVTKKRSLSHVVLPGYSSCPEHTSFLLSLNDSVPEAMCHYEAVKFRKEFQTHKNHLLDILFKLYNQEIFENKLPVIDIKWSGHLTTTAGITRSTSRITNTGKVRSSVIKLSKKIVDSPKKLRDVLIHELCHAANWLIDEQAGGHGPLFKKWANKVWLRFPEIPRVSVCHRYELKWNYIYKCTYCGYEVGKMKLNINRDTCGLCGGRVAVIT